MPWMHPTQPGPGPKLTTPLVEVGLWADRFPPADREGWKLPETRGLAPRPVTSHFVLDHANQTEDV